MKNIYNLYINDNFKALKISLNLAKKGLFFSSPNPRVGCIIVKKKKILGLGFTNFFKKKHAEINAIENAYFLNNKINNSIIYISLEPCNNISLTFSCINIIIKEKIKKIIFTLFDFNYINKNIFYKIKKKNINYKNGFFKNESYEINIGFFKKIYTKIPWIRTKIAISLDGKIIFNNNNKWISNKISRYDNQYWRIKSCIIITSINTLIKDNPKLNIRLNFYKKYKQPYKLIITNNLNFFIYIKKIFLFYKIIIFTNFKNYKKIINFKKNIKFYFLPILNKKINFIEIFKKLGKFYFNEIQIESGIIMNTFILLNNLLNEILLYISPKFFYKNYNLYNILIFKNFFNIIKFKIFNFIKLENNLRLLLRFN